MRKRYIIRPMEHGLSTESSDIDMQYPMANWATVNVDLDKHSIQKRWGYDTEYRDLGAGKPVQVIAIYQLKAGTRKTMFLTDTDLCELETGTDETWSYKTKTTTYSAKIASISGTTVTLKAGETPVTDGVADGDYFILDDDYTAAKEPQANWRSIASASDVTPSITLDAAYAGTTGTWTGNEKTGYVRHVYAVPDNERWQYAIVDDTFMFTCGGDPTQSYTGSGYAADADATYANKARYCIEYAERLIIADYGATRDPLAIGWSANNDITEFDPGTDATAGSMQFLESEGYITGLGRIGNSLAVYKRDQIILGQRTGISTDPFTFPQKIQGVGCIAPYSIINFLGMNAFLGRDDFYILEADTPTAIGEPIRYKFFDIVGKTQLYQTWGFANYAKSDLIWVAGTNEGQYAFVWNWRTREWRVQQYHDMVSCFGKGAL